MGSLRLFSLLLIGLCGLATTLAAEIKVTRRADGTIVVSNEGSDRRSSAPAATFLRPVPSAAWETWIDRQAAARALDSRLVRAVIQVESGYDSRAVSRRGAMGLMQLVPDTARLVGVDDPFDPQQNIRGGTAYLKAMIDRFDHRLELALAAYNAGPSAVEKHRGIPPFPETREYVRRVLTLYRGTEPDLSVALAPRPTQKIFVRRDANNRIVISTSPSAGR